MTRPLVCPRCGTSMRIPADAVAENCTGCGWTIWRSACFRLLAVQRQEWQPPAVAFRMFDPVLLCK